MCVMLSVDDAQIMCLLFFFFFQAEDGIRDLVRSRGLGDVYKRQGVRHEQVRVRRRPLRERHAAGSRAPGGRRRGRAPVSYTHLTLPTSDLV